MIISKWAHWSKCWVQTNGSFQNHPNDNLEIIITWCYHKPLLYKYDIATNSSSYLIIWPCLTDAIHPQLLWSLVYRNKLCFPQKWALIVDVFTSSILWCSFVSSPPHLLALHHQSSTCISHPSSLWRYGALTLTVGGQEDWEWG